MSGRLRVVSDDESEPLSIDELQRRGNALLVGARNAALKALRASLRLELVDAPRSYSPVQVRDMQRQAEAAALAWSDVAATLAELNREFTKSNRRARQ